jgi:hypothetical protein
MSWWDSLTRLFKRGRPPEGEDRRHCPYCGAEVYPDALDCWRCHRNFGAGPTTLTGEALEKFDKEDSKGG